MKQRAVNLWTVTTVWLAPRSYEILDRATDNLEIIYYLEWKISLVNKIADGSTKLITKNYSFQPWAFKLSSTAPVNYKQEFLCIRNLDIKKTFLNFRNRNGNLEKFLKGGSWPSVAKK